MTNLSTPDSSAAGSDSAPRGRGTEPVDRASFDTIYESLKAWDRWSNREKGAWNRVTPEKTVAAAAEIRTGLVVPTALAWATESAVDNPRPALHHMVDLGDREAPEPSTNKDFLGIDYHGKATTHLDALSHIAYRGELFGGQRSTEVVGAMGTAYGSVATLGSFVGRGVLIDLPEVWGLPWLEPGQAVYPEDLLEAERVLGVSIGDADAVLLRTGHQARRRALGAWDSSNLSAGWHLSSMPLLAERGVALLGSDGDSDVRPSPTEGIHSPIHILALTALGIPLLDNLDLEPLSETAKQQGRYEFCFIVAPLNVPGGTGSPVNPLAVF